jgi:hypothetical protein
VAARDDNAGWVAGLIATLVGLTAFAIFRSQPGKLVDLRDASKGVRYKQSAGSLAGVVKRTFRKMKPGAVRGITLHQWGVSSVGKGAHRKVTAHLSVGHDGTVYYVHPFSTWLAASHGFNNDTISIEVAGLYGKNSVVPQATIDGARAAVRFAVAEANRQGIAIDRIYAHRQSSKGRAADPGPDLWRRVAVPSGLQRFPEQTRGSGKTLPASWDPGTALA